MTQASLLPGLLSPMTPAEYIRLRREAAGLTIAQAAKPYYQHPEHAADVERTIATAELPGAVVHVEYLVDDYTRAFPMEPSVYRQLRDEPADRHPIICHGCGCTDWQACICRDGEDCSMGEGDTSAPGCRSTSLPASERSMILRAVRKSSGPRVTWTAS